MPFVDLLKRFFHRRKICRNCKCKKELHDVKEENSFEQFEILFGINFRGNEVKKICMLHFVDVLIFSSTVAHSICYCF